MRIPVLVLLTSLIAACTGAPGIPETKDAAPAVRVTAKPEPATPPKAAEPTPAAPPVVAKPTPATPPVAAEPTPAANAGETRDRATDPPCPDLVARLATCAEDAAFQTALFVDRPAGERAKLVAKLRAAAKLWTMKDGATSACRQWDAQGWGLDAGDKKPLTETCAVLGQLMANSGGLPETR